MRMPRFLQQNERFQLYSELPQQPLTFSEKDLAVYVQNARLDARLAEVLTEHLRDYWWKYDPAVLNKRLKSQPWPSAIKPMLLQILDYCAADKATRAAFRSWSARVLTGIQTKPLGLFFLSPFPPRSRSADREVEDSLPAFREAGFFAKDKLFNKGQAGRIKPTGYSRYPLATEDAMKLEMMKKIRARGVPGALKNDRLQTIDRTTLSKIKLGRLDQLSLKMLAKILDLLE